MLLEQKWTIDNEKQLHCIVYKKEKAVRMHQATFYIIVCVLFRSKGNKTYIKLTFLCHYLNLQFSLDKTDLR